MRRLITRTEQPKLLAPNLRSRSGRQDGSQSAFGTGSPRTLKRSAAYLKALSKLDAGTGADVDVSEVVEYIHAEFDLPDPLPLGIVTECYLGPPFQVHILDLAAEIVEHFEVGRSMPPPFEAARASALHRSYCAVEVYTDHLVLLSQDGSAVALPS